LHLVLAASAAAIVLLSITWKLSLRTVSQTGARAVAADAVRS